MSSIARYLARRLLGYFAVSLLVLVGLLLGLDLLEHGEAVMTGERDGTAALLRYTGLRLPAAVSKLNAIAALLAGLLTLEELRRHRELVALWNMGLSPWRIMAAVLPVGFLLAGLQLAVDDRAVPAAAAELRAWGVGPYVGPDSPVARKESIWLLSGGHVLRVAAGAGEGLDDVTVFRRDAAGNLLERLDAESAERVQGEWLLRDVIRRPADGAAPVRVAELTWTDPIRIDLIGLLAVGPDELPLADLHTIIANAGFGQFPTARYRAWFHARLGGALSPLLMILLAVGLARGENIRRGTGLLLVAGLAIGFTYFIYDGVVLAMGKAGWLPGWLAGWSPKAVMACVVAFLATKA